MSLQTVGANLVFMVLMGAASWWVYSGLPKEDVPSEAFHTMETISSSDQALSNTRAAQTVATEDDAVRGYLIAAQTLAEVYRFTNKDSYAGLCEHSESLYTLEGNSGGILKYIKMVGATEVFCSTSEAFYLIEAKLPGNGMFFCIDNTGAAVEQRESKEGTLSCKSDL